MPVFLGRTIKTPSWAKSKSPTPPPQRGTSQAEIDAFLGKTGSSTGSSPITKGSTPSSGKTTSTPPSSVENSSSLPYPTDGIMANSIGKSYNPVHSNPQTLPYPSSPMGFSQRSSSPEPQFPNTELGQELGRQYYVSNSRTAAQRSEINEMAHPKAQRSTKMPIDSMGGQIKPDTPPPPKANKEIQEAEMFTYPGKSSQPYWNQENLFPGHYAY